MIGLTHYLVVSAALFSLGILGVLTRRNAVNVLMGIELILNSANLNLVAFSRFGAGNLNGQLFAVYATWRQSFHVLGVDGEWMAEEARSTGRAAAHALGLKVTSADLAAFRDRHRLPPLGARHG